MHTIQTFNEMLNKSDDERFNLWRNYREKITALIVSAYNENPPKVLLLGAGNSDDIDLRKINTHAKHLYISDIDENALRSSLVKYGLSSADITLLPAEYTGLGNNSKWVNFVHEALKVTNVNAAKAFANDLLESTVGYTFLSQYHHEFDHIIISPIYTQLLMQQLQTNLQVLDQMHYNVRLIEILSRSFLDIMPSLIQSFNLNVLNLLADGGRLTVMSDIFEAQNGSDFINKIRTIINDNHKMDEFYKDYASQYGKGLGDFGVHHLDQMLTPERVKWVEWPFSKDRRFIVKVVSYFNISASLK